MDKTQVSLAYGETVAVPVYLERDGVGVSLTGATVTLSMVWAGEPLGYDFTAAQPTTWVAGATVVNEGFTCTADADQSANIGKLTFTPTTAFYTAAPPGTYRAQYKVVFADASVQKYPRDIRSSKEFIVIYPSIDGLDVD